MKALKENQKNNKSLNAIITKQFDFFFNDF